ncbi:calcineurin-binding protein cabin-1 [Strongylocentrotus purpuratus]|uniref:Calcineurin-binding protein cabin-1 n=1 Tax=Strongylocentrotus purpuratus TaxID=7668 RepID=A0A7M7T2M6_STRPU|nr:calcineurin-binding protein cabin-1 [Strongylocentrotus purpuratus]
MPIIRTLKETGNSYEAAKQRLLEATAHLEDDEGTVIATGVRVKAKRNRIISDSSSSSSSSSDDKRDDDDGDDDADDDDEDEEDIISQKRQRGRERKLLRNLEKEMKRKRTIVSISRPSLYKRTEMHSITPAKPKTKKPKSAMSMISALNDYGEDSDSDEESEVELTKEAQEEEAFSLYKKALEFQRSGDVQKAQETYKDLLQTRFLSKVKASQEERRGGVTNTAITLKYSSYKNLGNLAMGKDDTDTAMENYLEAVSLDSTDVTLWYRIGTVAVKLSQLALARVAFEQGLRCSKFHWPCLDYLCTVLYAINDYVTCLYYIAQALEKDKRYTKGFALRDQMYSEQPCLRRDCLDLFKHCENDVFHYEVPKDKRQKIVDEALSLRYKRQELAKAPPLPRIKFLQPLTELRWKPLGERLVALYDYMTSKDPPMSLVTIIDLEDYKSKETAVKVVQPERAKMGPSPAPMDEDPSDQNKATASPVPGRREGETEDRQTPTDTLGHMGEQTPGQMDEEAKEAEEPQQADTEESMDVDVETVLDEKMKPVESKTMTEAAGTSEQIGTTVVDEKTKPVEGKTMTEGAGTSEQTLGSSALTLKQLAEAFLKSRGGQEEGTDLPGDAASASAVDMEKEQEPPDSTTAVLDSTPAMSDLPNMELQADSAAGSSQDSIQQSGRESTMGESSQDKTKIQPEDAVAMDAEDSQAEKSRRGQKRKRLLRDMPAPGKRRSARVRNTTVKKKEEEEIVNYTEVLRQFLPSTLLVSDDEEEDLQLKKSGDKDSKEIDVKRARESPVNERDSFGAMETDDVHSLLVECQVNNGIIDVMSRYLERLVAKHDLKWPDGLAAVYLDVYKRLRKHISLPELLCCDEDEIVVREMSMMCLLSAEFNLDQCLSAKTNGNTPAASPAMLGANTTTCTYKWGEHHEDDMMYLQELTLMQYMLPDLWPVIPARVYWLKARYYRQIGKTADGEDAFERCKEVLMREEERRKEDRQRAKKGKVEEEEMETDETDGANERRPAKVAVANIKHGALISIASITSEVESLQRCQSLEQLQRLHASGDHGKVVELLRPTIRHTPRPVRPENTPERCSQLLLLIQSQMELKDAKESIFCCVLGMVETWQGVQREGMQVFHQLWLETLNKTLTHLQKAFESCEISSLGVGGTGLLRKAVNVLIKIIEWTMYQADVNETTNATSVMPWVVLYHTIKYEEDHLAAKSLPSSDHEGEEGIHSPSTVPMLPSSLMLLENAHDYLGRQTWCCNCDGALLKLYIRVLSTELGKYSEDERHPFFSDLKHTLEQCFFCLYGHPTKKTKTRHLQDHGAIEVQLDWSNCCYIFDYFKPKIFPEFDSYKTSSMSAELEGLLLKISKVIPQDARPENALELVQGYVDGSNENAPAIPEGFIGPSSVVKELYYLLADFHFKNKDFGKAIKFYLHDLCVSPDRLDSWAGMALARVGRLDLKLNNSTDTKSDGPIFKHGVAALRCFKRALEIDATNYALWIEYGSYAYILHSHASRQIKQKDQLKISDEDITSLSVKQAEMLEQAEHCFRQASTCEGEGDEEWLVHYMLGKVAEKRLLMEESLRHYLKASYHLHESEARYPKKIPYHNPTDFSLEALEMYFRIHSAILKLVQCSLPGTKVKLDAYGTLEGLVQEAAQLPFVRAEEKKREPSSEPSTDTEQDARIRPPKPDTPPSLVPKRRGSPIYVATPQDHDYLHEKYRRSRSSQEEPTTDTASESDIFSGDESMSSFLSAQRSTITLRPVPARRALSAAEAQAVPTTPDGTPSIVGMGEDGKTRGEDGMSGGVSDAKQPEKDQPEGRTTTEDIVAPCQDPKLEIPAIVVSKPSPEAEAATEGSESPADKDNVSMTSAEAATESSESPAEKDNVSMTSAEAATESSESSADKDNVSKTSAEDRKEVTEKPDELRAEVDPTVASAPPDDGERGDPGQAVVMDTEDAEQPIPASKGEEINQDGRAKTDVQSPVAMEMDEADTADQNEAEESVDRNRGGIEETKEVLRRTLEGNISEEKMEIGLSGDIVEPEEGDEGGKRGNQENLEIIKGGGEDGGQGEVKEADNAEELTLLQKPSVDGSKEDKNKKAEVVDDADKFLPGEMEVDQGTVLAQGQMKAGVQKTQPKDIEKNQRKEEEPQDIAKEPMSLISDEKKEGEIAELGSKETLYSDAPTLESISQVGEIQEDLLVLPSLEKEVLPMVDTRSKEADSIMDEEMVDKSGADDAPPSNSTQSGTNDEKQIQGHKLDESKVESQKQSSHTVDGDLSEDGGSAEGVLHLDGGPDGKPKDGDSERVEQDSPAGDGKGHKGEVPEQEEMKVKDESEAAAQERAEVKMDTSIQGKGAAVQNKEDDTTKIPVITEGLGTGSNVGTSLEMKDEGKEKDDAVTKKEEEAGEEPGQMTEGKTDGETVVEVDEETKKRHLELINVCLGAMKLCLQRFPQHYKAAYRMAYLYAYAPTHKNLAWSKDILIGGSSGYPPKTPTDHIVAPGLFSEQHKSKNLFQGIWRNPIQDIDRSGSFPWHMYRSVALLVYILRELKDHILLLQVTSKLYRIPEQGKKYLRDADRLFLAREAFDSYRSTIRSRLVVSPSGTAEESLGLVLSSFRCYQYTQSKQPKLTSLASELLITAFKVLKGSSIESEPALLDQAARFCDHHISFNKLPRTPTDSEGMLPRGYHRDSPSSSSSARPGLSSEGRRPVGWSTSSGSDQGGLGEPSEQDGKTAGRGEAMEATESGSREMKSPAEGSVLMSSGKTSVDTPAQESVRSSVERGGKEGGSSQGEESKVVSPLRTQEEGGSRRAEGSGSGMPEIGVKRKLPQMESTSENIASIVQEAARQYEKTEAQRRERLENSSPGVPQAKRFAGGSPEPPSSKVTCEPTSRVHIGALGSVTTTPRQVPHHQRPISLPGTSKHAVSSAYSGSMSSKMGVVKKMVGPSPHGVSRDPSKWSQAAVSEPSSIQSPLSPTGPLSPAGTGSFAGSFQKFLKTQQQHLSSIVKTFNVPSPESSVRHNPAPAISKVMGSGSLLGQVGIGSVTPKVRQTPGTSVAGVRPKLPVAPSRAPASHSSSQRLPLKPPTGISQVAKITSSTPSAPGVRQGSKAGGHREQLAARREHSSLVQAQPAILSTGNVGGSGSNSQEASKRLIQAGSSTASERPQGTGEDLLSIIDSTEEKRT